MDSSLRVLRIVRWRAGRRPTRGPRLERGRPSGRPRAVRWSLLEGRTMNRSDDRFWASQVARLRQLNPELFRPPQATKVVQPEPTPMPEGAIRPPTPAIPRLAP